MSKQLEYILQSLLFILYGTKPEVSVNRSESSAKGEYSTNIALKLAKQLGKSPMEIGLQVKDRFSNFDLRITNKKTDQIQSQSGQSISLTDEQKSVLRDIESVEVVKPGFINIKISEAGLSNSVSRVLKEEKSYGMVRKPKQPKKVMVEYTDPNPFKELHIGHLYSNAVGESFARLMEASGFEVKRADYFGDVGMHVAKSIWGMQFLLPVNGTDPKLRLSDAKKKLNALKKQPLTDRVKFLGQAYAKGATAYEEDDKSKESMKDINYLVFISAQEYLAKVKNWQPQVDYHKYVDNTDNLDEVALLFKTGREWSMAYFETIFRRLGTKFDYYYPESISGEYGAQLVRQYLPKGVFEESDGAVVYRGDEEGLHTRVFINSLGLPTYEAKELGLALTKHNDYPYDLSLVVTGNEINEYFKVLLSALRKIKPDLAAKTQHFGHGMVRLPQGKMSSRTGKVITGEWLIKEVKKHVYDLLDTSKSKYTEIERNDIAEKAAIAAIKYSMLRVSIGSNLAFDFQTSISFSGDSGPYLQYTYARCKSVMKKAGISNFQFPISINSDHELLFNPEEREVARLIHFFPEVVADAAANYAPNTLCTYLYDLAQAFNLFYQKHPILEQSQATNHRLTLTAATAQVLKNGLNLLGIETLERM